ncbi:MAG: tripartite tricarboxylate transporter substrate binding protein [Betaproteobacteria bacterium]|nr:tripartite tricarboxylate transporter substrate binding protein [Betaproteobacteria bacterium]
MTTLALRSAGLLISAVLATAIAAPVLAQGKYPSRPVRIVVPNAPGSSPDIMARLIAQPLSERLGQQVVVDNRAGAGTMIGGEIAAKSPPDGHTLLMGIATLAINPATYKKVPYDALRDFAPITQAVNVPAVLVVHPSLPARSVKELIALAKARPGHVPYKGSGPGVIDLLAGHVSVMTSNILSAIPHIRSGRMRALGVTSVRRATAAPDVPTIAEAGVPGYESAQWSGLLAPTGTPKEIIARLHKETAAILHSPETRERLAKDGGEPVASSPEDFGAFIRAETVKWAKVAKSAGIQLE